MGREIAGDLGPGRAVVVGPIDVGPEIVLAQVANNGSRCVGKAFDLIDRREHGRASLAKTREQLPGDGWQRPAPVRAQPLQHNLAFRPDRLFRAPIGGPNAFQDVVPRRHALVLSSGGFAAGPQPTLRCCG